MKMQILRHYPRESKNLLFTAVTEGSPTVTPGTQSLIRTLISRQKTAEVKRQAPHLSKLQDKRKNSTSN